MNHWLANRLAWLGLRLCVRMAPAALEATKPVDRVERVSIFPPRSVSPQKTLRNFSFMVLKGSYE